ncbi:MAG: 3-hydroxybutyrate dehydrogenase [Candidatus Parcubacteria bacterium]|nr:3-hydroxybutyrate dehydrogenase [Burkholderiales bacterium]
MSEAKKVAIVTGGASGIGLACAERLAADGMQVVIADMNEKAGTEQASRLRCEFVSGNLSEKNGCRQLVDETLKKHGTVHVLVNNAGYQHVSPIEDFPEEQWERMIALMLTAPFLLTRYCWPAMKRQKWGRVVNIASIHALVASPYKVGYIAAKHGLVGLTRTAALEGGEHGITVNAVCPAYVRTPLVDNQIADQAKANGMSPAEVIEKIMLAPAAVKRLIEPAEVAGFVAYLCSGAAGTITGSALTMDLGWTAR